MSLVPTFSSDPKLRTISVRGARAVVPPSFESHVASLLLKDTAASFTSGELEIERTLNGRYVLDVAGESILLSRELLVTLLIEFIKEKE